MTLADRTRQLLIDAMKQRGITRTQLATELGCSKANVTSLLADNRNFTVDTVERITEALNARITITIN